MEFNRLIYDGTFSQVYESNCGKFIKKNSKRSLITEIEVLEKLDGNKNIPQLIEVVDERCIITEKLNASYNVSKESISHIHSSINNYIKKHGLILDINRFDENYIFTELKQRLDKISCSNASVYIKDVIKIFEKITILIEKRKSINVVETLHHNDIHQGNIMMKGQQIVLIDWEDAMLVSEEFILNDKVKLLLDIHRFTLFIIDFIIFNKINLLNENKNKIELWTKNLIKKYNTLYNIPQLNSEHKI